MKDPYLSYIGGGFTPYDDEKYIEEIDGSHGIRYMTHQKEGSKNKINIFRQKIDLISTTPFPDCMSNHFKIHTCFFFFFYPFTHVFF